jgi:hypothetical protein
MSAAAVAWHTSLTGVYMHLYTLTVRSSSISLVHSLMSTVPVNKLDRKMSACG